MRPRDDGETGDLKEKDGGENRDGKSFFGLNGSQGFERWG